MSTRLEVFADVRCPFTHVGLRRVLAQREALGRDTPRLWVRAWPLELVNGEPLSAELVRSEIAALRASVAPDLFNGFTPATFDTTSLPALALANAAYRVSDDVGEAVSLSIRTAAFEDGLDLGDAAVLAEIADRHGVPAGSGDDAAVLADWREGQRRGVVGSPHFFCRGVSYFCPLLSIEDDKAGMRIAVDERRVSEFFSAVFA